MLCHRHRSHAGAAATVWNAERLVQIQVGNITPEFARACDTGQGVQVSAVDIHLAADGVHLLAHLPYRVLKHPVGGRVGNHNAGNVVRMLFQFGV